MSITVPKIMKRTEAAKYLGLSYWEFRGLEKKGLINPIDQPEDDKSYVRFRKSDLDKLINKEESSDE